MRLYWKATRYFYLEAPDSKIVSYRQYISGVLSLIGAGLDALIQSIVFMSSL